MAPQAIALLLLAGWCFVGFLSVVCIAIMVGGLAVNRGAENVTLSGMLAAFGWKLIILGIAGGLLTFLFFIAAAVFAIAGAR